MLVLSRHKNEAIVIGGRIKITVLEIRGQQIRLGIEAPKEHRRLAGSSSPRRPPRGNWPWPDRLAAPFDRCPLTHR